MSSLGEHVMELARTDWGPYVLFVHTIGEACLWWFAPDYILIALCVARPENSFWYALIASGGSTLGGMLGYGMGRYGGRPLIRKWINEETLRSIEEKFNAYEVGAIFFAGFTPVPYKFFAWAGGLARIRFWLFVLVTFIARGARFFCTATVLFFVGERVQTYIVGAMNTVAWIIATFCILVFVLWRWRSRAKAGG